MKESESNSTVRLIYGFGIVTSIALVVFLFVLVTYVIPDPLPYFKTGEDFRAHPTMWKFIVIVFALSTLPIMWQSGETLGKLWEADTSPGHRLTWIAAVSDIMFFGAFFVGIGLAAASVQLNPYVSNETSFAMFGSSAILVALCGLLWLPFTISAFLISTRNNVFPTWLNVILVATGIMNLFGFCGLFTLEGIFNPFNGAIAAGLPFYGPPVFVAMALAWGLAEDVKRTGRASSGRLVSRLES
ncbi:hypothetical protein [Burkholderia mayonis]|uniref:DUF998 domain-containing protein n=1 Tax=Burkholderia mayonis TaxID=1385591 RepID=A0A1B4FUK0_9BURK|nr:hypothetical protein [Burkholderia mayonis]AOJ07388.1 hypothetical protein WS71_08775 [Burkholderia mayonis]KVE52520.1 hypothetical protein WS71_09355 [Burkholderia mayonis]